MFEVILVIYFNFNPALMPLQKRPLKLAKMPKIRNFNVDFFFRKFWVHNPPQTQLPRGTPRLSSMVNRYLIY